MAGASERRSFLGLREPLERTTRSWVRPWLGALGSLVVFLTLFWALLAGPALGSSITSLTDPAAVDLWFQTLTLLAPLAALPLLLVPARARHPRDRMLMALTSIALLLVYGASLRFIELEASLPTHGLSLYFIGLALVLILLVAVGSLVGAKLDRPFLEGPRFRGAASALLLWGVLAYALPASGTLSLLPVGLGLVAMVVGAVTAGGRSGLHPLGPCRRTLVAGILGAVGLASLIAAGVVWCFSTPFVYLPLAPALVGTAYALAPPHDTATGSLVVPPGAYDPKIGRAWGWLRAIAGLICVALLVAGAILAAGWLPAGLCV